MEALAERQLESRDELELVPERLREARSAWASSRPVQQELGPSQEAPGSQAEPQPVVGLEPA